MKINIGGAFTPLTSYGIVTTRLVAEFFKQGAEVALFPLGPYAAASQLDADNLNRALAASEFFDPKAPSLRIWHQFAMGESVGTGTRIGFPIFELDPLAARERHHLATLDYVVVCSKWARHVVKYALPNMPIFVAPLGVDRSLWHENYEKPNDGITRFINVGKFEIRKNHAEIISAFNQAFVKRDPVELHLFPTNRFMSETESNEWVAYAKTGEMGEKVFIHPFVSNDDLARCVASCDVGVYPSRAEGFNLPLLEALSCGLQVIATNYSAHTEFLDKGNAHLIEIAGLEEAYDGHFFRGGEGNWAKWEGQQQDSLVEHMQSLHRSKQSGKDMLNQAGIETAKRFTWAECARKIKEIVE